MIDDYVSDDYITMKFLNQTGLKAAIEGVQMKRFEMS